MQRDKIRESLTFVQKFLFPAVDISCLLSSCAAKESVILATCAADSLPGTPLRVRRYCMEIKKTRTIILDQGDPEQKRAEILA